MFYAIRTVNDFEDTDFGKMLGNNKILVGLTRFFNFSIVFKTLSGNAFYLDNKSKILSFGEELTLYYAWTFITGHM